MLSKFNVSLLQFTLCFLVAISSPTIMAQVQEVVLPPQKINWHATSSLETKNTKGPLLDFDNGAFDLSQHRLPIYTQLIELPHDGAIDIQIQQAQFEPLAKEQAQQPAITDNISTELIIQTDMGYRRKQPYVLVQFIPLRLNPTTQLVEKLTAFSLSYSQKPPSAAQHLGNAKGVAQTTQSVLSQGNFVKISVSETGVHRITPNLLKEAGMQGSISTKDLRIYGNGNGLLDETAGTPRPDDLVENAIQVFDQNNDGIFNGSDYALLYAVGANTWHYQTALNAFTHINHWYDEHNYYFITDDLGAGKRINTYQQPQQSPTHQVNSFTYYLHHETEETNLIKSGRRWLGDPFSAQTERSFTFNIPNAVPNQAARLTSRVAARSLTGLTRLNVKVNGFQLMQHVLQGVQACYECDYGDDDVRSSTFALNSDIVEVHMEYLRNDFTATAYLDYLTLQAERKLIFNTGQMAFRQPATIGAGHVAQYNIQHSNSNARLWRITDPNQVEAISLTNNSFTAYADSLEQFIIFDESELYTPTAVGTVNNQNLHAEDYPQMLIVSHPNFMSAAERLADFHRVEGLRVNVVSPMQIYNEFSSGKQDISAIRDYLKMHYDRANGDADLLPKYLLLFGDASYDYKNIVYAESENQNFVPTFETYQSLVTKSSYNTDDFYALLDDGEGDNMGGNNLQLDIGVGRLPVQTSQQALDVVTKIEHYKTNATLGDWRNNFTFIADDGNLNLHLNHAEHHINNIIVQKPAFNICKIYADAYPQLSTSGGERYPAVNEAINNEIFNGTLMMNYIGHGGENGWAHERILTFDDIKSWDNYDKLPVFVTATCSFSKFDNPDIDSAGEIIFTNPKAGAIAVVTTTRLVYASSNKTLNSSFIHHFINHTDPIEGELSLGEILRRAKNDASNTNHNNRKFALLGDPALKVSFPTNQVVTTAINNITFSNDTSIIDTAAALSLMTIQGEVHNDNGQLLTNFNGKVYPTVFGKAAQLSTLGNDSESFATDFNLRQSILFKGAATVNQGKFSFSFIVPKDINYQYGSGRISYYADNNQIDAQGYNEQFVIGGFGSGTNDDQGPTVEVFMNNVDFVEGSITDTNPILLTHISDESGINTTGTGIGHDITYRLVQVDGGDNNTFQGNDGADIDFENAVIKTLNNYYKADLDSYQKGKVRYPLSNLSPGLYHLEVKAWDVNNNSGKGSTEFVVADDANIALTNVLNYPNPFTESTEFMFEHNRANQSLTVNINIMTISGTLIKNIRQSINPTGFNVRGIHWDGRDDFGQDLARGVYIYQISVYTPTGEVAKQLQKLVLLK